MNFERNVAVELFIMGATHHTHAACADLFNDEIVAGDLANQAWISCPSACILGPSTRQVNARTAV
jgi:hypothetical protein